MKTEIKKGDLVNCIDDKPLSKTQIGPVLTKNLVYEVQDKFVDSNGNEHLDIGLKMYIGFVSCLETGLVLAEQDIDEKPRKFPHYCYPARFQKVV